MRQNDQQAVRITIDDPQTRNSNNSDRATGLPDRYDLLVHCGTDQRQRDLLEQLTREGYTCRALIA